MAAGTATTLARGGRVSVQQIVSDAFGNALGSSLGAQIVQGGQQEDRLGNFINEQVGAQGQRDDAAWARHVSMASTGGGTWDDAALPSTADRYADTYGGDVSLVANRIKLPSGWSTSNGRYIAPDGTDMGPISGTVNVTIRDGSRETDGAKEAQKRAIEAFTAKLNRDSVIRESIGERDAQAVTSINAGGGEANQAFRRSEIEQMNREAAQSPQPIGLPVPSFQEDNDQRVIAGSYDRFSEIGGALSSRNYGEAWRHINFEASPPARAAAVQRLTPRSAPGMQQLDVLLKGGPLATLGYLGARAAGASAASQLNASTMGGIGDGVFGAFGGVAAARSGNRMPFTGAQAGFAGVQIGAPTEATKVGSSARMQYMGATPDKQA